jgi:two-component system, NarL family, response regulator DegU
MNAIKVFLVDDHQIIRSGIIANLRGNKTIKIVGEASDGKEAIDKIKELNPDVVLMDISMPKMDGIEATKIISEKYPNKKVLILSVSEQNDKVTHAFKAGAKGYILKDVSTDELIEAIENVYNDEMVIPACLSKILLSDHIKSSSKTGDTPKKELSDREKEVLRFVAQGYTSREIADLLFISLYTVNAHREHIMNKLNIRNIVELTRYAIDSGILK